MKIYNNSITINNQEFKIHEDNTGYKKSQSYYTIVYAFNSKQYGVMYGTTPQIVIDKLLRLAKKETIYNSTEYYKELQRIKDSQPQPTITESELDTLPF